MNLLAGQIKAETNNPGEDEKVLCVLNNCNKQDEIVTTSSDGCKQNSSGPNQANSSPNNVNANQRYRPQKYCAVCGDKAIACNFNAVTCESCKAFFRRNAFKEQRLKCLFENRCMIDRVTRRFCSKCRLLKCFQIGMKREWILTDEQKQIKRVKIMHNKQIRQQRTSSPTSNASISSERNLEIHKSAASNSPQLLQCNATQPSACPRRPQMRDASTQFESTAMSSHFQASCSFAFKCHYCSMRLASMSVPHQHPTLVDHLHTNGYVAVSTSHLELATPVAQPIQLYDTNHQSYNQQPQLHEMQVTQMQTSLVPATSNSIPEGEYIIWNGVSYHQPADTEDELQRRLHRLKFSDTERAMIEELLEGTKFVFEPREYNTKVFNSLAGVISICDSVLRCLIKKLKFIKPFKSLCVDDQILISKAACFKILLLRSTHHYSDELDGWLDPKTGKVITLDVLKRAKKSSVYDKHSDLIKSIPKPFRKDRFVMSTLSLALLFDRHSGSVQLDNSTYLNMLKKYLMESQPDPLTKYMALMDSIEKVNACNEEYNVFFSKDIQPEQITPLLLEIFDISLNSS